VEARRVEDAPFAPVLEGTSASRISVSWPRASAWLRQMPVDSSIMLSVISGFTSPGILRLAIRRSRSAELGERS
jgi:hypothetical protein